MDSSKHTHHAIDFIEFHVIDIEAAKKFYGAAFEWKFHDYGPQYAGICHKNGDGEVGGLSLAEKVSGGGGPLVVLYSDDLDASYKAVKAAGGKITKEPFEFPGGRRFQFRDPSSNELGVWALK